jgi:hypothetical protein
MRSREIAMREGSMSSMSRRGRGLSCFGRVPKGEVA